MPEINRDSWTEVQRALSYFPPPYRTDKFYQGESLRKPGLQSRLSSFVRKGMSTAFHAVRKEKSQ